ncbi:Uncharacterized protein SCF082_LOCUS21751, partial [Durusdinium trenchii]
MARSPAPVTSYQALRAKLNGLSYVQPFGEESLALVERLLEDLLKSAESYRLLQRAVAEREKQTQEVVKELEALHQEQPQLWRENVELHRRLLHNSEETSKRRRAWSQKHDLAIQELKRLQFLQRIQEARREELDQSVESLKARVLEMKKTARTRESRGIMMRGGAPPVRETRRRHIQVAQLLPSSEGAVGLPMRVAELGEELATARQKAVQEAQALEQAEAREEAAAADLRRYRQHVTEQERLDGEDKADDLQEEESQLSLLQEELQQQCAALRPHLAAAERRAELAEQRMAKGLRDVSSAQQRLLVAKQAALQLQQHPKDLVAPVPLLLDNKAQEMEERALEEELLSLKKAEEDAARVQEEEHLAQCCQLEEELRTAEANRPSERFQRSKAKLSELHADAAQSRRLRADLLARLAALKTHQEMQSRLLETQRLEVQASEEAVLRSSHEALQAEDQELQMDSKLRSAKGEVQTLEAYLQRSSSERQQLLNEVSLGRQEEAALEQEEQARQNAQLRLSRELESARAGAWEAEAKKVETRRKEEDLRATHAQLVSELASQEAELVSVQRGHRELSKSVGTTLQELDVAREECQSEQTNVAALQVRLRQLRPLQSARQEEAHEMEEQLERMRQELLQKEKLRAEAVEAQEEQAQQAQNAEDAEAEATSARQKLQEARHLESAAQRTMEELQAREMRLARAVEPLEQQERQLRREVTMQTEELVEEQRRLEQTKQGPRSVRNRLQELTEEARSLREHIADLESDQQSLQRAADVAGAGLLQLQQEAQDLQRQRGDMQWTIDKLQQAIAHQQGDLADDTRSTSSALDALRLVEAEVQGTASDLSERGKEEKTALEDLRHMTRENQLLHQQLRQHRSRAQQLDSASKEHEAQHLPMLQELRGREFQRDSLLAACQEAVEERQRTELAVDALNQQVESYVSELQELHGSFEQLRTKEEAAQSGFRDNDTEVAVLRARMTDATQRLEMQEFAEEELRAERSKLRLAAGAQQRSINEAVLGAQSVAAQAEALRSEVNGLQKELDQAREQLLDERRRADEAARSQRNLQALLAAQRQMQLQKEAERDRLRRTALEHGAGGLALGPDADDETSSLEQTLEDLAQLESQMAKEEQFLAEEAARLRQPQRPRATAMSSDK